MSLNERPDSLNNILASLLFPSHDRRGPKYQFLFEDDVMHELKEIEALKSEGITDEQ